MDIHNPETNKEHGKPKHGQNYPPERTNITDDKDAPDLTPNPGLSSAGEASKAPKHGQNYPPERTVVTDGKETPDITPNPGLSGESSSWTHEAGEKARFEAGKAKEKIKHQGREKARGFIHEGKERTAKGLSNTAGAIRRVGEQFQDQNQEGLGQYADTISRQIEGFSDYLDERNPDEIMTDMQTAARKRPWAVVGGAFILGMLTSRFLKASK